MIGPAGEPDSSSSVGESLNDPELDAMAKALSERTRGWDSYETPVLSMPHYEALAVAARAALDAYRAEQPYIPMSPRVERMQREADRSAGYAEGFKDGWTQGREQMVDHPPTDPQLDAAIKTLASHVTEVERVQVGWWHTKFKHLEPMDDAEHRKLGWLPVWIDGLGEGTSPSGSVEKVTSLDAGPDAGPEPADECHECGERWVHDARCSLGGAVSLLAEQSEAPQPPNPPWHRVGPAHEYEIRAAEQAGYERGVRRNAEEIARTYAAGIQRGVREERARILSRLNALTMQAPSMHGIERFRDELEATE